MKEKQRLSIGTGVSSILMIFVVLCLTTFGVLSFSSANADLNLTKKNGKQIEAYYAADGKAQEILMEIDGLIYTAQSADGDEAIYEETVISLLSTINSPMTIKNNEDNTLEVNYIVSLNEKQYLDVVITILPYESLKRYKVDSYRLVQNDTTSSSVEVDDAELEIIDGLWQGN